MGERERERDRERQRERESCLGGFGCVGGGELGGECACQFLLWKVGLCGN